jgi:hypothetical protein
MVWTLATVEIRLFLMRSAWIYPKAMLIMEIMFNTYTEMLVAFNGFDQTL